MNNFKTVAFSIIFLGNGQRHTYIYIFSVPVCDYTTNQFCIYNPINLNEVLLGWNSKIINMVIFYYLIAHMLKIKQWGANVCRSVVRSIQNLWLNRSQSLNIFCTHYVSNPYYCWSIVHTYHNTIYIYSNHRWSNQLLLSIKLSTSVSRSWISCSVSCRTVVLAASDPCFIHDSDCKSK